MNKFYLVLIVLISCSLTAIAASYKVNTSGKVVTPSGQVQTNTQVVTPQNLYTNFNSQTYVQTQQVLSSAGGTIDIVMDYSGSMANWINAAKRTMTMIVNQLPQSTQIGFRVFGNNVGGLNPYVATAQSIAKYANGKYKVSTKNHDSIIGNTTGACSATSQVVPVMQNNAATLINGMNSVKIGGSTPLTLALQQAVNKDFANFGIVNPKKIILITDGGENCGGDPCAFARQLVAKRKDVTIDVVLVSSSSRELRCLADTTGGKFYNTYDAVSFSRVLTESMQNAPASTNQTPIQIQPQTQNYEFISD